MVSNTHAIRCCNAEVLIKKNRGSIESSHNFTFNSRLSD